MKLRQPDNEHQLVCVQSYEGPRMIPCKVQRSKRTRRMYLQFDSPHYVTLKLPPRYGEKRGLRFIQEHGNWICEVLDRPNRLHSLWQYLMKQGKVSINGRWYQVKVRFRNNSAGFQVDDEAGILRLDLNSLFPVEDLLADLLKRVARECLPFRVHSLARQIGLKPHGVTVRDQKSRWGSCSETGGISLNWRLILIAPGLQDHVILHELAHVLHFDHSSYFHAYLESIDPKTREYSRRLNEEAEKVFSLGRLND